MPGELLMCVWDAAFALNPRTSDRQMSKKALNDVLVILDDLPSIKHSESEFDLRFKSASDVNMATFRRCLFEILADKTIPRHLMMEEVEDKCWEIAEKLYCSKPLKESAIKKLWQICTRLADVNSFPPQINVGVADWFANKVCAHLGRNPPRKSTRNLDPYTFSTLLDRLTKEYFANETLESVSSCVNELHSWLVLEVVKSGWLYKRTKVQANWTNWVKRWFVLTSSSLVYYNSQSYGEKEKAGGNVILHGAKVETMAPYKGTQYKLQGRFKVSNPPTILVEMSTEEESQRYDWIRNIEAAIEAANSSTTQIQRLLKDRFGSGFADTFSGIDQTELQNIDAFPVIHREAVLKTQTQPIVTQTVEEKLQKSAAVNKPNDSTDGSEEDSRDLTEESTEKIKAIFMKIDTNGNGIIDIDEFRKFICEMGLNLEENELKLLFQSVSTDGDDHISFEEFSDYFANTLLDESVDGESQAKLRGAFLQADRDGTGALNFNEYAEYLWDRKRSIRMNALMEAFKQMDLDGDGQVSHNEFQEYCKNNMEDMPDIYGSDTKPVSNPVESKLMEFYKNTDGDELAQFLKDRWAKFDTFKRYGKSGELVMTGGEGMVEDFMPGEYNLLDLACFSDLPPIEPKRTTIKGVKWESSKTKGISGRLIFPADFDGKIFKDIATSEHLRYYGCSFAEGKSIKVSLVFRHGVQDFTYENQYLEDYVTSANGGAGVEKHDFAHLDCPLAPDSGIFVLGKIVNGEELHLTAFAVPQRHTVYVPAGVIHSNDYLKGTWRTMLSDEADIDHVHLMRGSDPKNLDKFKFQFVE